MNRLSQTGILMHGFGTMMTNLGQVVEDEMAEALKTSQQEADDAINQLKQQNADNNAAHAHTLHHATTQLKLVAALNDELNAQVAALTARNEELEVFTKIDREGIAKALGVISDNIQGTTAVQRKAIDALVDLEELLQLILPEVAPAPVSAQHQLTEIATEVALKDGAAKSNV